MPWRRSASPASTSTCCSPSAAWPPRRSAWPAASSSCKSRVARRGLRAEGYRLAAAPRARELIGRSPAMRQLQREIELVSGSELSVLIQGETGVGKELVAQRLHARSRARAAAAVSLNCAALPETLVDSELFGHVKGAFTGAVGDRPASSSWPTAARCSSTRSASCRCRCRPSCCACCRAASCSASVRRRAPRRRAPHRRHQPRPGRRGARRALSRRPLPPPERLPAEVPPLRERGRDVLLLSGFFLEENRSGWARRPAADRRRAGRAAGARLAGQCARARAPARAQRAEGARAAFAAPAHSELGGWRPRLAERTTAYLCRRRESRTSTL